MGDLRMGWIVAGALGAAVVLLAASLHLQFRRDIRAAYSRLENAGSLIAETACGPIEYASLGEGAPVLVVHGIFGGFDQGSVMAQGNLAEGFRSIVPSRFGYLRTPLPDAASPATQADAYACLLDALGIERAAVMGTSAGATSAIQFALRYPDRCSSLVLISPNAPGTTEAALPPRALANVVFRSDFVFWLLTTHFRSSMNAMMGVPKGFTLTPAHKAAVADVMKTVLPVNPRSNGALFDMFVSNPDINTGYPLEEIAVPVLIISAVDDPLALYRNAQAMAERIPGATLATIKSGGHMLLGHDERVRSEIAGFLQRLEHLNASQPAQAVRGPV
ncbi:MAG: alpha/beta hydrolase [Candidatus Atribacteria bacterium]|nr:MAG: alpha/beta hydrolase [Candidatus Atribacteria bacterium]